MILKIDKTNISPEIIFDMNMNTINISGRMIMENAIIFFNDIKEHLHLFENQLHLDNVQNITLNIDVDYINSSALSQLLKLLRTYPQINIINWYYIDYDYDSHKIGEILKKMLCDTLVNIIVKYE